MGIIDRQTQANRTFDLAVTHISLGFFSKNDQECADGCLKATTCLSGTVSMSYVFTLSSSFRRPPLALVDNGGLNSARLPRSLLGFLKSRKG